MNRIKLTVLNILLFSNAGFVYSSIVIDKNNSANFGTSIVKWQTNLWRPIQENVRNTVVQVFSQKAEFDWLQPYRTPAQYGSRGSGFFISDKGEIVTNAHVVDQAVAVWIQIPTLGKQPIKVHVIGTCPDKDIALLQINDEYLEMVKQALGGIAYLTLGDSDGVYRAEDVLALGYPLGQESLKSTSGVVSGVENHFIQISAPINPGSSGGPLLNSEGHVVGINSSGVTEAQNIGYAIPINDLKSILPHLYQTQLLRNPYFGILTVKVSDELTKELSNPLPGGAYIVEVVSGSPIERAGVLSGDMIYEINGYSVDIYGEMSVPWSEDKISILDYMGRIAFDQKVNLVIYRSGERKDINLEMSHAKYPPIHERYPWYEAVEYEVIAGMVVMELSMNHIKALGDRVTGLRRHSCMMYQSNEPVLLITHIFGNSQLSSARTIMPGFTINYVNGKKVNSLHDFRSAISKSSETGKIVLKTSDEVSCTSHNIPVVLPLKESLQETIDLAQLYRYPISDMVQKMYQEISK